MLILLREHTLTFVELHLIMLFPRILGSVAAFMSLAKAVDLTGYEYVVVGSGAGGGVRYTSPTANDAPTDSVF
jgi:hypothetical protein